MYQARTIFSDFVCEPVPKHTLIPAKPAATIARAKHGQVTFDEKPHTTQHSPCDGFIKEEPSKTKAPLDSTGNVDKLKSRNAIPRRNGRFKFASPPVMIYVGPNEESFSVPADLLKSSSQYFLAMLTKGWIEAQEGMVFLTDIDPADFNQYVEYLYSGKIAATPAERTEVCYMAEYERLIHCYALGDRFEDAGFRDAIIDRIIENSKVYVPDKDDPEDEAKTYPFGPVVELAYSFGSSKSPLRRLIVDQHVTHGVAGWIDEHKLELYNKEFLYDLSIALFKNRPAPSKLKGPAAAASTCDYHEHQRSGKRCYKTAS